MRWVVVIILACSPLARGQCLMREWIGTRQQSGLGYSLAAHSNRFAYAEFQPGGMVRVLERAGRSWNLEVTLSSGEAGFPWSMAMSENRVVATAPYAGLPALQEVGKIVVFRRIGDSWLHESELVAVDAHEYVRLGWSVATSGDVIVAGSVYDLGEAGSAYVFRFDGLSWHQEAKLTALDGTVGDRFGQSVAIDGGVIVVGAFWDGDAPTASGSAYIFERDAVSGLWQQVVKLAPPNPRALGYFGKSVAVSGTRVLTGQPGATHVVPSAGEAYVYDRDPNGTWRLTARFGADDPGVSHWFGTSVALAGDYAMLGAPGDFAHGPSSGSAYVFRRESDGTWRQAGKLVAQDSAAYDQFASSVAIASQVAFAGAWQHDLVGIDSGAAYAFAISGDLDGDGVMDVCECLGDLFPDRTINESDLAIMLYYWNQGPGGDIDRDGDTDEADLGLLLANWGTNCP
ncbi:MAG: FG-GAP repeat protein [Phycisphaerae bacterium]